MPPRVLASGPKPCGGNNCTARKDLGTSLALQYYAGNVGSSAGGDLV